MPAKVEDAFTEIKEAMEGRLEDMEEFGLSAADGKASEKVKRTFALRVRAMLDARKKLDAGDLGRDEYLEVIIEAQSRALLWLSIYHRNLLDLVSAMGVQRSPAGKARQKLEAQKVSRICDAMLSRR
jgi:hypothetical protein